MDLKEKVINTLQAVVYSDCLGYLNENSNICEDGLKPFYYRYDENLVLQVPKGQWSYATELMLINIKCLVDQKEEKQVVIDYKRLREELKLWWYYRHGDPSNVMNKLKLGKEYYHSDFYWKDNGSESLIRIIPIALANKNFTSIEQETYKNIIYFNRHPEIILTGLLLVRSIYFLLEHKLMNKDELIINLKEYLMDLRLSQLQLLASSHLPQNYKIQFEQEKINYLIFLDRLKDDILPISSIDSISSKHVFLKGLYYFFNLHSGENQINKGNRERLSKEELSIIFGLSALQQNIENEEMKDMTFIKNMAQYLLKLRKYEIGRNFFMLPKKTEDVFQLNKGEKTRHYLLNQIYVKDKIRNQGYEQVIIETKSGQYHFIKKLRQ